MSSKPSNKDDIDYDKILKFERGLIALEARLESSLRLLSMTEQVAEHEAFMNKDPEEVTVEDLQELEERLDALRLIVEGE